MYIKSVSQLSTAIQHKLMKFMYEKKLNSMQKKSKSKNQFGQQITGSLKVNRNNNF